MIGAERKNFHLFSKVRKKREVKEEDLELDREVGRDSKVASSDLL